MSSIYSASPSSGIRLASLAAGTRGVVVRVHPDREGCADRLQALGVTPGARLLVLQTFPGIVFQCDQTEIAVEPMVAASVLVAVDDEAEEPSQITPGRREPGGPMTPFRSFGANTPETTPESAASGPRAVASRLR
jgi:Fe2+ transport system protein FeoA